MATSGRGSVSDREAEAALSEAVDFADIGGEFTSAQWGAVRREMKRYGDARADAAAHAERQRWLVRLAAVINKSNTEGE